MRNPLSESNCRILNHPVSVSFLIIVSEMKDAISLGVGEPDFDTPWHIRDEGIYSLEKGTNLLYIQCRFERIKELRFPTILNRRYGLDL